MTEYNKQYKALHVWKVSFSKTKLDKDIMWYLLVKIENKAEQLQKLISSFQEDI